MQVIISAITVLNGEGVMPFRMKPWEIALIVAIILIVFGVGKLPQVGGATRQTIWGQLSLFTLNSVEPLDT